MKTARRGRPLLVATLALAALLAPATGARADDAEKEKEKAAAVSSELEVHFPPPSTRWKVLAAGVILTGGAWAVSFGCAEEWPYVSPTLQPRMVNAAHPLIPSGPPESALLKIPIAGPWIALGNLGCGSGPVPTARPRRAPAWRLTSSTGSSSSPASPSSRRGSS